MSLRRLGVIIVAALALALPACAAAPPATGTLDFRATTVEGAAFDGSTLAGAPAVLWFWAPF